MSSYDLVDLYFEMGEKLPGELACLVFEMLREDPSRLDGRCEELVLRIVESWKVRFPIDGEVEEAVALLKPRTTIPEKIPEGYPAEKMPLLEHVCRLYACYILACAGSNVSRASRTLGVHRRTLHRWQREKLHAMGEGYVTV